MRSLVPSRRTQLISLPESGYFNPLLAHTEALAVRDAKAAGANGFIVVDLPPEEAVGFRSLCTEEGCVPLELHLLLPS